MANENVNKVVYNGNTLIDLTSDTVTEDDVVGGKTFHLPSGAIATGSAGVVRYDQQQSLTAQQKTQAKDNIDASSKPTYATLTLLSSGWSSGAYSLEVTYPFASYDIEVNLSPSATETQRDAFAGAMLTGSPNSNVLTALGEVPSVDIPVFLKVWAK